MPLTESEREKAGLLRVTRDNMAHRAGPFLTTEEEKNGNSRGKRPKKLCTWKEVMGENSQNLNINSLNKTSNEGKYIDFIRYLNASPALHSRLQRK